MVAVDANIIESGEITQIESPKLFKLQDRETPLWFKRQKLTGGYGPSCPSGTPVFAPPISEKERGCAEILLSLRRSSDSNIGSSTITIEELPSKQASDVPPSVGEVVQASKTISPSSLASTSLPSSRTPASFLNETGRVFQVPDFSFARRHSEPNISTTFVNGKRTVSPSSMKTPSKLKIRHKRCSNACSEHKRKHQRCPAECPGRKKEMEHQQHQLDKMSMNLNIRMNTSKVTTAHEGFIPNTSSLASDSGVLALVPSKSQHRDNTNSTMAATKTKSTTPSRPKEPIDISSLLTRFLKYDFKDQPNVIKNDIIISQ